MPQQPPATRYSNSLPRSLALKPEELKIADGVISGGGKSVSYGELIGGKSFSLTVDHQDASKD